VYGLITLNNKMYNNTNENIRL